jgi:Pyruvate/2-oxoacid:ferredoxin oxidoreductase delta subunit
MAAPTRRHIVVIDEEKCNGCGQCAAACAEGAIQVIEGKARLVKEEYCDGLGACLGECPQQAIRVEERVAEAFDPEATEGHLRRLGRSPASAHSHAPAPAHQHSHAGCPSALTQAFTPAAAARPTGQASALGQWPVQLHLVYPAAPYFRGADLLVTADCVPFAYAGYHADLLAGKAVVVGCPKLDGAAAYAEKLAAIFSASEVRSITVAIMEVPCCRGLVQLVQRALAQSGKDLPAAIVTISIRGEKLPAR